MIASLVVVGALGLAQANPVPDRCEFLRAVLVAQWPLEAPGTKETFYLDQQTRERPIFLESDGTTPVVADAAFVAELFGALDPDELQAIKPHLDEFASYFETGTSTAMRCEFPDLRVTPAAVSREGLLDDQDALQFPRISLGEPMFSADGRFAMGGYAWSFVPYRWMQDDCLFERVDGEWRIVECVLYPLKR